MVFSLVKILPSDESKSSFNETLDPPELELVDRLRSRDPEELLRSIFAELPDSRRSGEEGTDDTKGEGEGKKEG